MYRKNDEYLGRVSEIAKEVCSTIRLCNKESRNRSDWGSKKVGILVQWKMECFLRGKHPEKSFERLMQHVMGLKGRNERQRREELTNEEKGSH